MQNLDRMLEKCRREQWRVGDLDWSQRPRDMSEADETTIVQYFTDMAGIERLAGALFEEQRRKVDDPVLREIFRTFVKDEVRHSHAAQMLADYYDVNHYRVYELNPALRKFTPHFVDLIKYLAPELANAYITGGELILDIALLRSLNDYVGDDMSQQAMDLINRDESRHIAIDFHMVEYYCSTEHARRVRARPPRPLSHRARAVWALLNTGYYAAPFFKSVFFQPMEMLDPSGKRMKEAFKRIQMLGAKPQVAASPFARFMTAMQSLYNDHPVIRVLFGRVIERVAGVDGDMLERLVSESERRRASRMSFAEMADEALALKAAS